MRSLALCVAVCCVCPAGTARAGGDVYVKVVLPNLEPADGTAPERWVADGLKARGESQFRAVTGWVRLTEEEFDATDVWSGWVPEKVHCCPVSGRIEERMPDGTLRIDLQGWSPGSALLQGTTFSSEAGTRSFVTVRFRADLPPAAYVAVLVVPNMIETTSEVTDATD